MLLAAPGAGHQGQIEEIAPLRSAGNAVTILVPAYGFSKIHYVYNAFRTMHPLVFMTILLGKDQGSLPSYRRIPPFQS